MATQTYTALEPIRHNGVDYAPGAPMDLDARTAGQLLAVGAIEPPNETSGDTGESPEAGGAAALQADSAPRTSTATVTPIGAKGAKARQAKPAK